MRSAAAPAGEGRTVGWALDRGTRRLRSAGAADPALDAALLLSATLDLPRLELALGRGRALRRTEADLFEQRLRRRAAGEPLQYVLGEAHFRHLVLGVDHDVLIPRPETERLVDEVLAWLAAAGEPRPRLLDVGTGSGAIALALLQELPRATAVATDVCPAALRLAAVNGARAGVAPRLELRTGDLLEPVRAGERFTVIAANLPYVAHAEMAELPREVRRFEPRGALLGGETGAEIIARLVGAAPRALAAAGLLICESAPHHTAALRRVVRGTPGLRYVRAFLDLSGRRRGFLAAASPPT
ncbi:MAG: peptide chain release factor N(5)-glutamine methyltransferase [Gemmatimonadota bacterium]